MKLNVHFWWGRRNCSRKKWFLTHCGHNKQCNRIQTITFSSHGKYIDKKVDCRSLCKQQQHLHVLLNLKIILSFSIYKFWNWSTKNEFDWIFSLKWTFFDLNKWFLSFLTFSSGPNHCNAIISTQKQQFRHSYKQHNIQHFKTSVKFLGLSLLENAFCLKQEFN